MTEYIIYSDVSLAKLSASVSMSLKDGWQLAGGVSVTNTFTTDEEEADLSERLLFCQAMAR